MAAVTTNRGQCRSQSPFPLRGPPAGTGSTFPRSEAPVARQTCQEPVLLQSRTFPRGLTRSRRRTPRESGRRGEGRGERERGPQRAQGGGSSGPGGRVARFLCRGQQGQQGQQGQVLGGAEGAGPDRGLRHLSHSPQSAPVSPPRRRTQDTHDRQRLHTYWHAASRPSGPSGTVWTPHDPPFKAAVPRHSLR